MTKCDYGCGNEATFTFKNGANCCSRLTNFCPAIRKKISDKNKGEFKGVQFWKMPGFKKTAWNKGMELKGDIRWINNGKKGMETRRKNGLPTGSAYTIEKEELRRSKISAAMKNNPKAGGLRRGSGRGMSSWYDSPIAGRVYLRSTYELEYVKWLDVNNIPWKQNTDKFPYIWEGKNRYYYPDFFLLEENCFVEVKGYETKQDAAKWKAFPFPLRILKKQDLILLGLNILK